MEPLTHKGTQTLTTERLVLRKILPEDAAMVYTWMSDPEVCRYECWQPHPSVDYSRGYIAQVFGGYEADTTYQWGMQLGGALIGAVSVVNVSDFHRKALLGYCLARRYWSQGYTTEAVRAVVDYMLGEVGLNRLEATHSVNNPASGRVLQKAGFALEGRAIDYYFCNAGFQDSDLYAITRSRWQKDG